MQVSFFEYEAPKHFVFSSRDNMREYAKQWTLTIQDSNDVLIVDEECVNFGALISKVEQTLGAEIATAIKLDWNVE